MAELIQANWIVLVVALVIGILIAWWVFASSRRTRVEIERRDEEAGSTAPRRNQALIDAAPAAASDHLSPTIVARDFERAERIMSSAAPNGFAGAQEVAALAATPLREPAPEAEPRSELPVDPLWPLQPADDHGESFAEAFDEAAETMPLEELDASEPPPATFPIPPSQGMNTVEPAELDDDLTRIKGLGPKLEMQLRELGVTSLAQIAAWDETDIDGIDAQLGRFQGRIRRDNWREQAQLLAAGDKRAYEDRFGKL